MHNLIEYSDNYSKTSGILWQFCKDIPAVDNDNAIVNFTENNLTDIMSGQTEMMVRRKFSTKNVEIMVPLKYLSNFWRTREMSFVNCEINLIVTWSKKRVIVSINVANQNATLEITDTKLCSCSDFINTR